MINAVFPIITEEEVSTRIKNKSEKLTAFVHYFYFSEDKYPAFAQ